MGAVASFLGPALSLAKTLFSKDPKPPPPPQIQQAPAEAPSPTPDNAAIQAAQRRSVAAAKARKGRTSTRLTGDEETLGGSTTTSVGSR